MQGDCDTIYNLMIKELELFHQDYAWAFTFSQCAHFLLHSWEKLYKCLLPIKYVVRQYQYKNCITLVRAWSFDHSRLLIRHISSWSSSDYTDLCSYLYLHIELIIVNMLMIYCEVKTWNGDFRKQKKWEK